MSGFALAAVFLALLPAAGPGLGISVSLAGKAPSRNLQVTFHNASDRDILIPLGMILRDPHPTMLEVRVKMPDGQMPRVIYTGAGVVGGYAEPLTMGLRAGETYTLALPLDRYYVLGDNWRTSLDSRFWGTVDERDVVGEAVLICWSRGAHWWDVHWSRLGRWLE